MRGKTLHYKAWLVFLITFCALHFAFCASIIVGSIVLGEGFDGHGAISFIFGFIPAGPVTGFEFAVGYAVVEIIVSISRPSSFRVQAITAICAAAVSYSFVWIVLALRSYLPNLSENVAEHYLGLNLRFEFPWGPTFLGGLSALIVMIIASAVGRRTIAAQQTAGADR